MNQQQLKVESTLLFQPAFGHIQQTLLDSGLKSLMDSSQDAACCPSAPGRPSLKKPIRSKRTSARRKFVAVAVSSSEQRSDAQRVAPGDVPLLGSQLQPKAKASSLERENAMALSMVKPWLPWQWWVTLVHKGNES